MEKKELTCIKVLEGEVFEIRMPLGKGDMWCIPCDLPKCLEVLSNRKEEIPLIVDDPCNANLRNKCADPCYFPCCDEPQPIELEQIFKFKALKSCCVCIAITLMKTNCNICDEKLFKIVILPKCPC